MFEERSPADYREDPVAASTFHSRIAQGAAYEHANSDILQHQVLRFSDCTDDLATVDSQADGRDASDLSNLRLIGWFLCMRISPDQRRSVQVGWAMTYEATVIVDAVDAELARCPFQGLKAIAGGLGIDRHTITRALKHSRGRTFDDVQRDAIFTALDRLREEATPMSREQRARTLGCSVRTLGRWMLRREGLRARGPRSFARAPK